MFNLSVDDNHYYIITKNIQFGRLMKAAINKLNKVTIEKTAINKLKNYYSYFLNINFRVRPAEK